MRTCSGDGEGYVIPASEDAFSARFQRRGHGSEEEQPARPAVAPLDLTVDELERLFSDPAALRDAIDRLASGNVRRFAEGSVAMLRVRPDSVRRRIYRALQTN